MKNFILLLVVLFASSLFAQNNKIKSSHDEMAMFLKEATVQDIQCRLDQMSDTENAKPVMKALLLEKQKKEVLSKKRTNKRNISTVNTGSGNNNSNSSKTDSLLVVLISKVDGIDSRLSNVETRLDNIESMILVTDRKIDSLSVSIVRLGFTFEKNAENSSLVFLKKGELMVFHSEYLALTTNDEVLMDFVKSLSKTLQIRLNPLDFTDYANGSLEGEPKKLMEKILKVIGSVDSEDPEIIWEFFVEQSVENGGLIRQTFEKF